LGLALDEFKFPENPLLLAKYLKQFRKIFFAGAQSVRRFDVEMLMAAGYPKEEWKRLYSERWGETI
jgi:hypothetical protein